ncbi:hypothetical protein DFH09DRAFT_1347758 [Mycena vulgaris]|nr:hypothetical protein DFH09DRAFT_1347758 [Mycena vulgaris]
MSGNNLPAIVLPPLDEYSLVGIWISSVLYGMNVILYGCCLYIILRRRNNWTWFLLSTSTVLFIVVTMHIGASLRQLIEAFIQIPKLGIPGGSIFYWINLSLPPNTVKEQCYIIADITQDIVLIWRLYMVYGNNLSIALIPFVLELGHIGVALYGDIVTVSTGSLTQSPTFRATAIAAWTLVLAVNVGTTCAIAGRLFYMGKRRPMELSGSTGGETPNRYLSPIYTIIECGAIFTLSSVVLVAMYAQGDPKLQTAVNVTTQLAALTPFLIIVRAGFGIVHGGPANRHSTTTTLPALSVRMPNASSHTNLDGSNNGYPLKQISINRGTFSDPEL